MTPAVVMHGVLGWGNRKAGLEAYGPGGRWSKLADGTPTPPRNGSDGTDGDLLGDALDREGIGEGADLVVVAVPRGLNGDRELIDRFVERIREIADEYLP